MRQLAAVVLAALSASMYSLATSLQALEARRVPSSEALRASLIARLVRRPLWLAGTAAGIVAWPLQALALALGSVALVMPALGFGLIVLLVLGVRVLHERIGPREIGGVLAIVGAVAILGFAAPPETGSFTTAGTWIIALSLFVIAPAPYLLRAARRAGGLPTSVAAGLGWAWVGFGTSLLDLALAQRNWWALLAWGAAVAAASWGALLDEMTSLQTWAATRAIPVTFGIEMILPAALAPFLTHAAPLHPWFFGGALVLAIAGVVVLGTSRAVSRAVTAG
jgi:drug/metabolite transporter (DMT)-like permease